MAVPSSGELRLYADIWESFNSPSQGNNSLHSASIYAGFSTPDAMSDFYGFVDAVPPSVTTNNATSVGGTSMTANGNITNDGGGTISERGFYFGTNSSSPTNNTKYTVSGTTGAYSRSMTGLSSQVTYYYWAYATNEAGTTYGARITQATTINYPSFRNGRMGVGPSLEGSSATTQWLSNQTGQWIGIRGSGSPGTCYGATGNYYYTDIGAVIANGCPNRLYLNIRNLQYSNNAAGIIRDTSGMTWNGSSSILSGNQNASVSAGNPAFFNAYATAPQSSCNPNEAAYCYCVSDIRLKTNINYL